MVQFDERLVVGDCKARKRGWCLEGRGEECYEGGRESRLAVPLPRYSPAEGEVSYQPWTKTHLSVRRGSPYGA